MKAFFSKLIRVSALLHFKAPADFLLREIMDYPGFYFRELDKVDFLNNPIFLERKRYERYIEYVKQGHVCYGFVNAENQVAAYFWVTQNTENAYVHAPVFEYKWLLESRDIYIWDCRTVSEYRRKGFYKLGLQKIAHLIQKQYNAAVWISCSSNNAASIKGIIAADFHYISKTRFIMIGSMKYMLNPIFFPRLLRASVVLRAHELIPKY